MDATIEELILLKLRYNPTTGLLFWREIEGSCRASRGYNSNFSGKRAGTLKTCKSSFNYREVHIGGRCIKEHRVAWFLHYGVWPVAEIDHINRVRSDNKITNLRDVSRNVQNKNTSRRCDNTSGKTGVYFCKRAKKWVATLQEDGVRRRLGNFKSLEEAVVCRDNALKISGFNRGHGEVSPYG